MDRRVDLFIGLFVIALGAAVILVAGGIRPTGPVVDPIGPRGFPYLIGVAFLLSGAVIVYGRLRRWDRGGPSVVATEGEPDEPDVPASAPQAWTIMAASVIYALALNPVGYLLATPIYVAVALRTMRMRSWTTILVMAIAYTVLTYLVFAILMRVNLPLGPLTGTMRSLGLGR
jgi:putative tricarboxylic transport membrane protein